jgi:uncharacterized protein YuzE
MKLHLDPEADALYLRIDDSKIVESDEVSPGIILDFNSDREVVGIEMLNLSSRSREIRWNSLQFESSIPPHKPTPQPSTLDSRPSTQ